MGLFHSVRRHDHQADGHGALEATCLKIVRAIRVVNASWQKWTNDKNKNQWRRAKSLLHIYWASVEPFLHVYDAVAKHARLRYLCM
jgi:hypothetical protein